LSQTRTLVTVPSARSGSGAELAAEGCLVEVVDEGALAVDLDDREPLAVAPFELLDARDVDLRVGKAQLGSERGELRARALAQRAVARVEERDATDRARG
jgi:hypothetical protein